MCWSKAEPLSVVASAGSRRAGRRTVFRDMTSLLPRSHRTLDHLWSRSRYQHCRLDPPRTMPPNWTKPTPALHRQRSRWPRHNQNNDDTLPFEPNMHVTYLSVIWPAPSLEPATRCFLSFAAHCQSTAEPSLCVRGDDDDLRHLLPRSRMRIGRSKHSPLWPLLNNGFVLPAMLIADFVVIGLGAGFGASEREPANRRFAGPGDGDLKLHRQGACRATTIAA